MQQLQQTRRRSIFREARRLSEIHFVCRAPSGVRGSAAIVADTVARSDNRCVINPWCARRARGAIIIIMGLRRTNGAIGDTVARRKNRCVINPKGARWAGRAACYPQCEEEVRGTLALIIWATCR